MRNNTEPKTIEQLMAEADELIRQINPDVLNRLEEKYRAAFEEHASNLKKIKVRIQGKSEKEEPEADSGADGTHEAIMEIVKAMGALKKYLV